TSTDVVTPACYDVRIGHHRRDPLDYHFTERGRVWLVDLDALPALPRRLRWLCGFSSADHLGSRARSIRRNVDEWLAHNGAARPQRVLMLANPRVLGYVFNPLTVFYCYASSGRLTHVVAEVRNTYGGRHCYLLEPDTSGLAETDKAFYVSPFNPVDGHYTMRVPEPGARLNVSVTLHRPHARPFTAAMSGTRRTTNDLWTAVRTPLATRAVMYQIKKHGIALYARGMRPSPRPRHGHHQTRPARRETS
ncbi:MAG: DUF1365 domain-containing protein, partial [Nocardioidaceae bacterium]